MTSVECPRYSRRTLQVPCPSLACTRRVRAQINAFQLHKMPTAPKACAPLRRRIFPLLIGSEEIARPTKKCQIMQDFHPAQTNQSHSCGSVQIGSCYLDGVGVRRCINYRPHPWRVVGDWSRAPCDDGVTSSKDTGEETMEAPPYRLRSDRQLSKKAQDCRSNLRGKENA